MSVQSNQYKEKFGTKNNTGWQQDVSGLDYLKLFDFFRLRVMLDVLRKLDRLVVEPEWFDNLGLPSLSSLMSTLKIVDMVGPQLHFRQNTVRQSKPSIVSFSN